MSTLEPDMRPLGLLAVIPGMLAVFLSVPPFSRWPTSPRPQHWCSACWPGVTLAVARWVTWRSHSVRWRP